MRLLQRDSSSLTLNNNDSQMSNMEPYLQGLLVELWVVGQLVKYKQSSPFEMMYDF